MIMSHSYTNLLLSLFTVIRDYDGQIYFREHNGGLLGGGFQPVAKPVFHNGIPENFEFQLLPEDWDNFRKCWEFSSFDHHGLTCWVSSKSF